MVTLKAFCSGTMTYFFLRCMASINKVITVDQNNTNNTILELLWVLMYNQLILSALILIFDCSGNG